MIKTALYRPLFSLPQFAHLKLTGIWVCSLQGALLGKDLSLEVIFELTSVYSPGPFQVISCENWHQTRDILSWNSSTWLRFQCRNKAFAQGFHYWVKNKRKVDIVFLLPSGDFSVVIDCYNLQVITYIYNLQVFTEPSLGAQDCARTWSRCRRKMMSFHYSQGTYRLTKQYQWEKGKMSQTVLPRIWTLWELIKRRNQECLVI